MARLCCTVRWGPLAAAVALLVACASPLPTGSPGNQTLAAGDSWSAPDTLAALYAGLALQGGNVWQLDAPRSAVRIHAFRAGRAAALGHNHVLSAPTFTGYAYTAASGLAASRFDLAIRLDALTLDDAQHRAALGRAFAPPLSAEAIAATRTNMLGDAVLQAQQFPWVRVRSLELAGEVPKVAARVAVELHGQTREQWVPLTVTGLPQRLRVQGALVLRQSDFGVRPFSVLGGLLAVQDALVVDFDLVADHDGALATPP
jgi:polyisoprenoid-binding protein YceI